MKKEYWVCPDCEAINRECNACGKESYSAKYIHIKPSMPTIKGNFAKKIALYPLYFLSNLILKNYAKSIPNLILICFFLVLILTGSSIFLYKSGVVEYLVYYYKQ